MHCYVNITHSWGIIRSFTETGSPHLQSLLLLKESESLSLLPSKKLPADIPSLLLLLTKIVCRHPKPFELDPEGGSCFCWQCFSKRYVRKIIVPSFAQYHIDAIIYFLAPTASRNRLISELLLIQSLFYYFSCSTVSVGLHKSLVSFFKCISTFTGLFNIKAILVKEQ